VVRARPWYYYDYYEPPYYVIAGPALAAVEPPPPPPPPARRAPAPAPKRFALSADALFDFDRAVLRPEGRRQLDKLAADLKRAEYDIVRISMVRVTGHTDRLGSAPYNMNLSMRRAEAVKTYLVGLGIPAAKIVAAGRGEANPVTRPGQCPGEKASRELIACLQPDRRVEVEISFAK
jgi:OOP family OmpA-OmpF porin